MEDVHNTIKKLQTVDFRISEQFRKISRIQIQCKSLSPEIGSWFNETFITGSLGEGGLWAKCFELHNIVRILEADYMTPIGQIEDTEEKLKPIDHSPGFFTLKTNDLLQCMNIEARNRYEEWQATQEEPSRDDDGQTLVLKFIIEKMFSVSKLKKMAVELVADILFLPRQPSKVETTFTTNGPSAETVIKVTSAEEHLIEVHLDTVPCIELCSWPSQCGYRQWLNRKRKWPHPQFVFDVQRLICIVAKAPPLSENEIERDNVWRLSFSKAEMLFTATYTENQREIYFLFKIIFYANIKKLEIAEKRMPSYFCKTTMFWVMEEIGGKFGEGNFEEAIQTLFNQMNEFLEDRYFPNFFYPLINMLDGYPEDLISICSDMIKKLSNKPIDYVPLTLNAECEFLEILEKRLLDVLDKIHYIDAINDILFENETDGQDWLELFLYLFEKNTAEK